MAFIGKSDDNIWKLYKKKIQSCVNQWTYFIKKDIINGK